ncbi:MAG: hypothetical protein DRG25_00405 [Deltaproteobacteria bacterium]|nr:MAG: hypothetical protein DRG25_00405 [Deltaproteobacteria bacterium]
MENNQFPKTLFKNLNEYIVCFHRKNNPRISVIVCEQTCRFKKRCKEYQTFSRLLSQGRLNRFSSEAQIV